VTTETPPVLEVRGLHKSFGVLRVLRGLDLSVPDQPGTAVAVLGQNGAGKTTLLNLITRLLPADEGAIAVYGHDVMSRQTRHLHLIGIGRTFQSPRLLLDHSVIDNVLLGLVGRGTWRSGRKVTCITEAEAALERVGLVDEAGRAASALPFGSRKLVELARALAAAPRLLLLDEPAAGLSSVEETVLGRVLVSLRDDGVALLLIEHRMDLVTAVARRVVFMEAGTVIFDGDTAGALRSDVVRHGYLGVGFDANDGEGVRG